MSSTLEPGSVFPDIDLPDHVGNPRRLSQLAAEDPVLLQFYRGWWCPKEQAFFKRLTRLQDEAEVAYTRFVSVSVDPPEVAAAFGPDGGAAGYLAAWRPDAAHPDRAGKIDGRAVDPGGASGFASLVLAPAGLFLPFDDVAVTAALRQVLRMPPPPVFSTLLVGDDRLVGALTAAPEAGGRLDQDPFANIFPALVLRVEAGILGSMPAPAGPTTQRYGADNPWPWDRFSDG